MLDYDLRFANLHCQSCLDGVKRILESSAGQFISSDLTAGTISCRSSQSLAQLRKALEVFGLQLLQDSDSDLERSAVSPMSTPDLAEGMWASWSIARYLAHPIRFWLRLAFHQRHLANCRACQFRASHPPEQANLGLTAKAPLKVDSNSVTETSSHHGFGEDFDTKEQPLFDMTFSLSGLDCASCVTVLRKQLLATLDSSSFVKDSLLIDLGTMSLKMVVCAPDLYEAETLASFVGLQVGNAGYQATLQTLNQVDRHARNEVWKVTCVLSGLTCAGCVNKVIKSIRSLPHIQSVHVDLSSSALTVVISTEEAAPLCKDIEMAIADLGYGIVGEMRLHNVAQLELSSRRVRLQFGGIYCENCIKAIEAVLSTFAGLTFQPIDPTTLQTEIEYDSKACDVRLRDVLQAFTALPFSVKLRREIGIEELARQTAQRARNNLAWRFLVSFVIAVPTLAIAVVPTAFLKSSNSYRSYWMAPWLGRAPRSTFTMFWLATFVFFYVGHEFHVKSYKSLRSAWSRQQTVLERLFAWGTMDLLVTIGTGAAYLSSTAYLIMEIASVEQSASLNGDTFDAVIFLNFFIIMGRLLDSMAKGKTRSAIEALFTTKPRTVTLANSEREIIPVDLLDIGDKIVVPVGGSPASDGFILSGQSAFDESSLTGESKPVRKHTEDRVFTGTTNLGPEPIVLLVDTIQGKTTVDKIADLISSSSNAKSQGERIAETITAYFVPVIVYLAAFVFCVWLGLGLGGALSSASFPTRSSGTFVYSALQFAIATLVIACPCGIGLAVPTAQIVGVGLASRHGILCRGGGAAFEVAAKASSIAFDKTGTITKGELEVHSVRGEITEATIAMLGLLESGSSHPIATALVRWATTNARAYEVIAMKEIPGQGIQGALRARDGGTCVLVVGNAALMDSHSVHLADDIKSTHAAWAIEGKSLVYVAQGAGADTQVLDFVALLGLMDCIRPEAPQTVAALRRRGMDVSMISGDDEETAKAIGLLVGIDPLSVFAPMRPEGKRDKILNMQTKARHRHVVFVGDGINDAPALAAADVSIAMGSGSQIATSGADFVINSHTLSSIPELLYLSRRVKRRIWLNLLWAGLYNVLLVPFAAGVFYPISQARLSPSWSALAMSLSSVSVVLSSLALNIDLRRRWSTRSSP